MPAHIFIQGEKFSNTQNIVKWIASRTGWPVLTDGDLIGQAGSRFGLRAEQIERALYRRYPIMKRIVHRREKAAAYLKTTLAETLRSEAGIFYGMAGHMIPRNMPHVLRVLVTAETTDRIRRASRDRKVPEKKARHLIRRTDHQLLQWHQHFSGGDGVGAVPFDVVVPTDVLDTETAAHLILEHLTEKANAAPDVVKKALDDFTLAAGVQLVLAEKGYDIATSAEGGKVLLTIDRNVLRLKRMAEKLKRLVGAIPDVCGVEIEVGGNFHQTDIYRRHRFEMSSRMRFESYDKRRRRLRRAAISNLPSNAEKRIKPEQIGLNHLMSL